ncbi:MAG: EhaF family protein [Methanobrevibacter sp.]|jgi:energy-converting hydrogenase A subunit F|nr:EhaF family protein [Candidatus Methanoflexus mossambicus]
MRIGDIFNKLASPRRIPRLFAFVLAIFLIIGFTIPIALNTDQIYPRMAPQEQMNDGLRIAPYDRGGEILKSPGITKAEYPENSKELGMINSYMSPIAEAIKNASPYFGTSIYSSPGGLIDEILYYTRGFDTILESTILMMSFIIASWLALNYTINRTTELKSNDSKSNDSKSNDSKSNNPKNSQKKNHNKIDVSNKKGDK